MIPSTTDDLLAEIEAHATAMTDTAASLARTIRVQQVTIATMEAALRTKTQEMTTEQLLEELEHRLLERKERKENEKNTDSTSTHSGNNRASRNDLREL